MPTCPFLYPLPLITFNLGLEPPSFPFSNPILFFNLFSVLFATLSLLCPPHLPHTSPPPSAPRPTPRPGGRAPPDPLPSVSAAPQQIGGMVWDFLGK